MEQKSLWPRSLGLLVPLLACLPLLVTPLYMLGLAAMYFLLFGISLFFVALAVETWWRRRLSRLWYVVPAVWFGGYYGAMLISEIQFAAIDAQIRAANANQTVVFEPARHDLIVKGVPAESVLKVYDVPVVFQRQQPGPGKHYDLRSVRLASLEICKRTAEDEQFRDNFLGEGRYAQGAGPNRNVCLVSITGEPAKRTITVTVSTKRVKSMFATREEHDIRIDGPEGTTRTVRAADARRLFWLPAIELGLISSRIGFVEGGAVALGFDLRNDSRVDAVAQAIGLKPATEPSRAAAMAAFDLQLQAFLAVNIAEAEKRLDQALADPYAADVFITKAQLSHLVKRPELIAPRAGRIVDALIAALDRPIEPKLAEGGGWTRALAWQALVMALPDDIFAREVPRFLQNLATRQARYAGPMSADLINRMAALGPVAGPALERIAFEDGPEDGRYDSKADMAVKGLCRLGSVSPGAVDRLVDAMNSSAGRRRDLALILLMRMGRRDLVDNWLARSADRTVREKIEKYFPAYVFADSKPEICDPFY